MDLENELRSTVNAPAPMARTGTAGSSTPSSWERVPAELREYPGQIARVATVLADQVPPPPVAPPNLPDGVFTRVEPASPNRNAGDGPLRYEEVASEGSHPAAPEGVGARYTNLLTAMERNSLILDRLFDGWTPPPADTRRPHGERERLVQTHIDNDQFLRLVGTTPVTRRSMADFGHGDKEPPFPKWNGEKPAITLRPWLKSLRLWRKETKIPEYRHGMMLKRSFDERTWMWQCTERVPEDYLVTPECGELILREVLEACKPPLDIEPEVLMEQLTFNMQRDNWESFVGYVNRFQQK